MAGDKGWKERERDDDEEEKGERRWGDCWNPWRCGHAIASRKTEGKGKGKREKGISLATCHALSGPFKYLFKILNLSLVFLNFQIDSLVLNILTF